MSSIPEIFSETQLQTLKQDIPTPLYFRLYSLLKNAILDGTVANVNDSLRDHPDLANESPYEKGWLFTIEPTKLRKNLKGLYFGQEAHNFISDEKEKLFAMANEDLRLAADGGGSVEDISQELEGENWAKFVKKFLRT